VDRGYHFVRPFDGDPLLAPLQLRDDFKALNREIGRNKLAVAQERGFHTPAQLGGIARVHLYLGEYDRAIEFYERAIRQGGPLQERLIDELHQAREQRAQAHAEGREP
jgi:tetratricopeptide (TPR) repeat protein